MFVYRIFVPKYHNDGRLVDDWKLHEIEQLACDIGGGCTWYHGAEGVWMDHHDRRRDDRISVLEIACTGDREAPIIELSKLVRDICEQETVLWYGYEAQGGLV